MNNVTRLYTVSPNTLAAKIDVGTIERGIGAVSDTFTEVPLPDNQLFRSRNYQLFSSTDSNFATPINPETISLKRKTTDVAFLNRFNPSTASEVKWAKEYTLYLRLPEDQPLVPGENYTLNFAGDLEDKVADVGSFTYDPRKTFSEAIHVSQIGFDPDDPKIAFLSEWQGIDSTGNEVTADFTAGLRFWIVDTETGRRVEHNNIVRRTKLSLAAGDDEDVRGGFQNYTGADVYEMDFSDFSRPGNYVIEVEGVGQSFDFSIAEDNWDKAFQVSMKGLYNQRSGTAIGGPFSDTEYQRSFHPDDGIKIFPTDERTIIVEEEQVQVPAVQLIDTKESLGNVDFDAAFRQYVQPFDQDGDGDVTEAELTLEIQPLENAWGGYKDAGDWDRRIQHLFGTRQHLELLELFSEYFETVDLGIPETTQSFATIESLIGPNPDNGIPDLLDESLWSLDFFRRLQNEDGGVRGGLESAASPKAGETSWEETLLVFAYAPDPYSSYIYAGAAARAARVLKAYDTNLAARYQDSAIRAMNWAESEVPTDPKYDVNEIRDERNLAALELYLLTEQQGWNNIFLEDTVFKGDRCQEGAACADVFEFQQHDQQQAAFLYARAPRKLTNSVIRANAAAAIQRAAENSLSVQNGGDITFNNFVGAQVNGTAFKWTKNRPFTPLTTGQLATPQIDALLQAHTLTGDQKYLDGAILGSQFAAGANPLNTVFTTGLAKVGLADRESKNPFVIDTRLTGQDAPDGITSYGPIDLDFQFSQFQTNLFRGDTSPQPEAWPAAEAYFDNYWNFQNTEFTIHDSIAPSGYAWGYFAASDFEAGPTPDGDIIGTSGADILIGTSAGDLINGLAGKDRISGKNGNDTLNGGPGFDILKGEQGNDELNGGTDRDRLLGGAGRDILRGGAGNDVLKGQTGADQLLAGMGNDKLMGGDGNDTLDGQAGFDTLTGGKGRDLFILAKGLGRDRIRDFQSGADKIGLKGALSFSDLTIKRLGTAVLISSGNDDLAILADTNVNTIGESDFINV